jgi:hypothetical protein
MSVGIERAMVRVGDATGMLTSEEERRAYAISHGYFWLPCPRCGRMFGGHEWDSLKSNSIQCERDPQTEHGTCCKGEKRNPEGCERAHATEDKCDVLVGPIPKGPVQTPTEVKTYTEFALTFSSSLEESFRAIGDWFREMNRKLFEILFSPEAQRFIEELKTKAARAEERAMKEAEEKDRFAALVEGSKENPWPLRYEVRDRGAMIEDCTKQYALYRDAAERESLERLRAEVAGDPGEAEYRRQTALLMLWTSNRFLEVGTNLQPNRFTDPPRVAPFEKDAKAMVDSVYEGEGRAAFFEEALRTTAIAEMRDFFAICYLRPIGSLACAADLVAWRNLAEPTRAKIRWLVVPTEEDRAEIKKRVGPCDCTGALRYRPYDRLVDVVVCSGCKGEWVARGDEGRVTLREQLGWPTT